MLDLGGCQLLDADILTSVVYLSPVQTQPPSNDGYFMLVCFRVKKAQIFGCLCLKQKCMVNGLFLIWILGWPFIVKLDKGGVKKKDYNFIIIHIG